MRKQLTTKEQIKEQILKTFQENKEHIKGKIPQKLADIPKKFLEPSYMKNVRDLATGGWRKETIRHKKADGTYVDKEVWMGGNDNDNRVQKTNFQLEQENKAAEEAKAKAESEAKEQAAKDQADAYKKKRTAMVGSRSLFANPGGRGFFD